MTEPKSVTASIRLPARVASLARSRAQATGYDLNDYLTKLIMKDLGEGSMLPPDLQAAFQRREELVRRFGAKAVEIARSRGPNPKIVAETARRIIDEDPSWLVEYAQFIGGEPFGKRVAAKKVINPALSRWTKSVLHATAGGAYAVKQPSIFSVATKLHFS